MTDEQIEKALECCCSLDMTMCEKCPYFEWIGRGCVSMSTNDALALIKRQREEIDRLRSASSYYIDLAQQTRDDMKRYAEELKAEAIREFAERLKGCILERDDELIDEIARQMTEEHK